MDVKPADFCRGCGCRLPPRLDETYCRAIEPMRRHMEELHEQNARLTAHAEKLRDKWIDAQAERDRLRVALERLRDDPSIVNWRQFASEALAGEPL